MKNTISEIRKLIDDAVDDSEFQDLCHDHFPKVYRSFTTGQDRSQRIRQLIEYAERHKEIPKLLEVIKQANPVVYAEFESRLVETSQKDEQQQENSNLQGSGSTELNTCDILILSANPRGTEQLQLNKEADLISYEFQNGQQRFTVRVERAVRVEELSRHLLKYEPIIVHFSGHGGPNGEIIFEDELGQVQPIAAEDFARLLSTIRGRIECVVLNTCFSTERADVLADHVGCVVGMTKEFDDESAIRFAVGFYRGLAFGKDYYTAFELGRNEITLKGLPDGQAPHFFTRDTTLISAGDVKPRVTRTFTPSSEKEQPTATLYPLWFGTNRRPIDSHDLSKGFSGERDNQVYYGTCQVAVPKSHKIGSTGSPWWQRLLTLKDDRLRFDRSKLNLLAATNFWYHVRNALQERDTAERMALVFIHGFNVSFEDAALRAAQIGFDLQTPGITAFYSWPSKAKLTGYTVDEASIEASEQYIAQFLTYFAENSGSEQIHIIAHSMGNRGLLRAMQRILQQAVIQSNVSFGQVFLAAPDVDPDVFKDLARAFEKVAKRTTLYISSKDKALATSGIIHDHPRAGFYPPPTILSGIDTIEVSNIDLTFLGHGYYAEARDLLQDMSNLLRHNESPSKRFGLREAKSSTGEKFWVIGR